MARIVNLSPVLESLVVQLFCKVNYQLSKPTYERVPPLDPNVPHLSNETSRASEYLQLHQQK